MNQKSGTDVVFFQKVTETSAGTVQAAVESGWRFYVTFQVQMLQL